MSLIPVPEKFRSRLQTTPKPSKPRDSATVVLTRDGDEGLEIYLMRRQSSMSFAPGMCVFPGGSLHASDTDASIEWSGPDTEQWAAAFGTTPELARGLVVAAVRELFEETGVLLAGAGVDTVCQELDDADIQSARRVLDADKLTFAQFLSERKYCVRSDLLFPWSRWITPEFEPKRFDTRFFVAALPEGQEVGELSIEASEGDWYTLPGVFDALDDGSLRMLPPTEATCRSLAGMSTADFASASDARSLDPVMPTLVTIDGVLYLQTGND